MGASGFFGKLFDFSFEEFITPTIVRIVYIIFLVLITIGAVIVLLAALFSGSASSAIAGLIFVPLFWLVYVIFTRIWLEVVAVIFRIAEPVQESDATLKRIEELIARQGGITPAAPPTE